MAKNNAAKEKEAKRNEAKKIIFILGRHSCFFWCLLPLYFIDIVANKIRLFRRIFEP